MPPSLHLWMPWPGSCQVSKFFEAAGPAPVALMALQSALSSTHRSQAEPLACSTLKKSQCKEETGDQDPRMWACGSVPHSLNCLQLPIPTASPLRLHCSHPSCSVHPGYRSMEGGGTQLDPLGLLHWTLGYMLAPALFQVPKSGSPEAAGLW